MGIGQVKRRAVFLDRDGVLNHASMDGDGTPHPPPSVDGLIVYADAPECLRRLRDAGFLIIVATNQPDIERGTQTLEGVTAINDRLRQLMPIDHIRVCQHTGDHCHCRKPKPGMLTDARDEYGIDLSRSYMVGDRYKDIEAGQRAGCAASLWIDHGIATKDPDPTGDFIHTRSLTEATVWILENAR